MNPGSQELPSNKSTEEAAKEEVAKEEAAKIPLHATTFNTRWGDMDAMGHVNNTVYFRYCEQARMEWFASLDLESSNDPSSQIVIINAFCEFLVPVIYPCSIVVEMSGGNPGKSSFMSYYQIRDAEPGGTSYCNGTAKIVWVNADGNKSVPLPDMVRALLQG